MPTQWAHQFYWNVSSTAGDTPPVLPDSVGGYPSWQSAPTGVASMIIFGPPLAWLGAWLRRLWWAVRAAWRWSGYPLERRRVIRECERLMADPSWEAGLCAVRDTAQTLGFATPIAWVPYARELKSSPGRAQNVFRHQRAMALLRDRCPTTLNNPDQNLLIELAYHGWSARSPD